MNEKQRIDEMTGESRTVCATISDAVVCQGRQEEKNASIDAGECEQVAIDTDEEEEKAQMKRC